MNLQELKKLIDETIEENNNKTSIAYQVNEIEFEDYDGNTIALLSDFDLADIEDNAIRLQSTIKKY